MAILAPLLFLIGFAGPAAFAADRDGITASLCALGLKTARQRAVNVRSDQTGVYVYQAFHPSVAEYALKHRRFSPDHGFSLSRMTWLKLSLPWMLYRADYGRNPNQERILSIKISHAAFLSILRQAVPSTYDPRLYADVSKWREALRNSDVVFQWDPDRDIRLRKSGDSVLQVGIRGDTVRSYAQKDILEVRDITDLARQVEAANLNSARPPDLPPEKPYPLPPEIRRRLLIE